MSKEATVYRFYINGYPPEVPLDTLGITFDEQGLKDLMEKLQPMIDGFADPKQTFIRATIFIPGVGRGMLQKDLELLAPDPQPISDEKLAELKDWIEKKENC